MYLAEAILRFTFLMKDITAYYIKMLSTASSTCVRQGWPIKDLGWPIKDLGCPIKDLGCPIKDLLRLANKGFMTARESGRCTPRYFAA